MIWRPTSLRGRLIVWYTGILSAMLALLAATSVVLLDHGLRNNLDDSLNTVAHTIAQSAGRPFFFDPEFEDSLQSMLGPELAERFFQLLDPFGRPDPRLAPRNRSRLSLSAEAMENAKRGHATFETVRIPAGSQKQFRLLTLPVVRDGATC